MIWPFGKSKNPPTLPIDGPWTLCEGQRDGKPVIVRFNSGYEKFRPVASYDHQVRILAPFRNSAEDGMPSGEESWELQGLEDELQDTLESDAQTLLVAVVTGGGAREFLCYSNSLDMAKQRIAGIAARFSNHSLQIQTTTDARWTAYRELLSC
jgi:hypothetical protein